LHQSRTPHGRAEQEVGFDGRTNHSKPSRERRLRVDKRNKQRIRRKPGEVNLSRDVRRGAHGASGSKSDRRVCKGGGPPACVPAVCQSNRVSLTAVVSLTLLDGVVSLKLPSPEVRGLQFGVWTFRTMDHSSHRPFVPLL